MLLDEGEPIGARLAAAKLVSELAVSSARRHVCIRFRRTTGPDSGALSLAPMGVTAMTAMVFVDRDSGPSERELFEAARASGGNPGRFLRYLRAASVDDHVSRAMVVHESPASYVIARAQAQFERARALATGEALGVPALIGLEVIWTDERRFADAEAAFGEL